MRSRRDRTDGTEDGKRDTKTGTQSYFSQHIGQSGTTIMQVPTEKQEPSLRHEMN
jgi:hypothetical protein